MPAELAGNACVVLEKTNKGSMWQGNWGVALVAGVISISFANLLNTFLRDCVFLFGVPTLSTPGLP
jgi:hypothetical protein